MNSSIKKEIGLKRRHKFADDTKIGRAIKNSDDARMLQDDLIEVRVIVTMDFFFFFFLR